MWSEACSTVFVDVENDDLVSKFERLVEIWWSHPQACNNRICGSNVIDDLSLSNRIMKEAVKWYPDHEFGQNFKIRQFVPKRQDLFSTQSYEIMIRREHECSDRVYFYPVSLDLLKSPHYMCAYAIELECDDNDAKFSILTLDNMVVDWIEKILFPKLVKWLKNVKIDDKPTTKSLKLVSLNHYATTYQRLKTKYGKTLVQNWTERTDPQKFIYEDIAIASYLMELWSSSSHDQFFIDVGCGNGLLVYLLSSENHRGLGFDLRKRGIWDLFIKDNTDLRECVINPTCNIDSQLALTTAPDWLIGNHSDELTPWIPVMAARLNCSFFLLPCCPHDFYSKFGQRHKGLSRYGSYLNYIENICNQLGFKVERDRLKIPSTKRTCFIGRLTKCLDKKELESKITRLLSLSGKSCPESAVISTFQPRDVVEPIRNCSQLSATLQNDIISIIVKKLLEVEQNFIEIGCDDILRKQWNLGGHLTLKECSELLTFDQKQQLKSQCGGIQTFLRNNKQIFHVVKGSVGIRNWNDEKIRNTDKYTKPCLFLKHHPDGCPMLSKCPYYHQHS